MKVLITGGSGLLGRYLRDWAVGHYKPSEIIGITHASKKGGLMHLDLSIESNVHRLFSDHKPDVIIHTAAMGNVDYAELYPQYAYDMNVGMTEKLVRLSAPYNPTFVYVSSNAVYSGLQSEVPYNERSPQNPVNVYGRTKRMGEQVVRTLSTRYLIVRPFMLYGFNYSTGRQNWFTILRDAFNSGRQMKLIDDIVWQPTSAKYVANVILDLLDKKVLNEDFNVSQGEAMSLYEFGVYCQNMFNQIRGEEYDLIEPVHASKFPTAAQRPVDTSYDITKIVNFCGRPPTLEQSIGDLIRGDE